MEEKWENLTWTEDGWTPLHFRTSELWWKKPNLWKINQFKNNNNNIFFFSVVNTFSCTNSKCVKKIIYIYCSRGWSRPPQASQHISCFFYYFSFLILQLRPFCTMSAPGRSPPSLAFVSLFHHHLLLTHPFPFSSLSSSAAEQQCGQPCLSCLFHLPLHPPLLSLSYYLWGSTHCAPDSTNANKTFFISWKATLFPPSNNVTVVWRTKTRMMKSQIIGYFSFSFPSCSFLLFFTNFRSSNKGHKLQKNHLNGVKYCAFKNSVYRLKEVWGSRKQINFPFFLCTSSWRRCEEIVSALHGFLVSLCVSCAVDARG